MRSTLVACAALAVLHGNMAAQTVRDGQLFALATFADEEFFGAGLGYAVRPGGRVRLSVAAALGRSTSRLAARSEVLVGFHLDPTRQHGWAVYGGAGAALVLTERDTAEYLLLVLGVESRPGGVSGWFAEVGLGGGVRVAAGLRLRQGMRRP